MIYGIEISAQAEADLWNIYLYIATNLQSPETGESQLERIKNAVYKLDKFPERFRVYDEEPWRSLGVRVLVVDNYIVLYCVEEKKEQVTIIRVMYGGRDIKAQLKLDEGNLGL